MAVRLFCFVLVWLALPAFAQADMRAHDLQQQIRCVVCNAQSIADSDAPLAADLRRDVASRVAAGESDSMIKTSLRQRYGDQILLQPPVRSDTLLLWLAPLLLLLLAGLVSWRLLRRRRT